MTINALVGMVRIDTKEVFLSQVSLMRSLIGDRFLKKFAGGILRRLKPTDETVAEPESHENSLLKPGNSENQAVQGEEAPKNIETVDEVTKSFNQKDE